MKRAKIENTQKITRSKEFNRNYRCKVYGLGMNTLVGFRGFVTLVGDLEDNIMSRVRSCPFDKCVVRLRRGIKLTFYYR